MDWTIRVGDILTAAGLIGTIVFFIFALQRQIERVGLKLGFLEQTFKAETKAQNDKIDRQSHVIERLAKVLDLTAQYEVRFHALQQQIDDLKHWRGFINPDGNPPHGSPHALG